MAAVTDAEMLVLLNECLQAICLGQSYAINGRVMTRANMDTVLKAIKIYEQKVATASSTPGTAGFGLVSFNGP